MWLCTKCNTEFERLVISWGTSGDVKVDILDYFCPICGNTGYSDEPELKFLGSINDRNAYWNEEWER